MTETTIGVDISKDHLEAHRWPDGAAERFGNDRTGHRALIHWIGERPIGRVVFEPTGPYHRGLERALAAAGLPFAKVNPARPDASPKRPVGWPRPIGSMPPCSRAWALFSSRNCTGPRARSLRN